jgi:hypothetical protein
MTITFKLLPALLLAGAAASAQQTAYDFKTVLRPESQIGGSNFKGATIGSAAINDEGEVAFIAHWNDRYSAAQNFVFTLRRLVAKEGDLLAYGKIASIALYGHLAISPHGIVAFEATEGAATDMDIFVERQALVEASAAAGKDLFLNERDEPVISPRKTDSKEGPFAMLPANHRGQFLIAINAADGPYLVVATPKK